MVINKYCCGFCGYVFLQDVNTAKGEIDITSGKKGKKGTVSDQVACPKCNNFLKTWQ